MILDNDPVIEDDPFQRRYRSFLARPTPPAGIASNATAEADDGIPLLTEVIDAGVPPSQTDAALLDALRGEIREEISSWLVDVLPVAVANASQQILAELETRARHSLLQQLDNLIETHRSTPAQPADLPPSL
jgi:hypothetical protein